MTSDEGVAVQAGWGPMRRSVLLTALSLLIGPNYQEQPLRRISYGAKRTKS
jgi:hypothetical protein